jgi:hypothetical protein
VKLTLDSSEPLEDAMRVVGALYGVTLVLTTEEADVGAPAEKAQTPAARKRTPASRRTARERKPARQRSTSNAEVRSWARQKGLTVSDRGRIPASVMTAYQDSHTG